MTHRAQLPTRSCYWAVVTQVGGGSKHVAARRYAAEPSFPVALEQLHTAEARLPDGRYLIAAIGRGDLQRFITERPGLLSVGVDDPPSALRDVPGVAAAASGLEFRYGPFAPAAIRQLQVAIVVVLVISILVIAGVIIQRELAAAGAASSAATALRADSDRLAMAATAGDPGVAGLPPALALQQAVRRLRATSTSAADGSAADVLPLVEAVWSAWPRGLRIQMTQVTVDSGRVAIRGRALDLATADQLRQALAGASVPGGHLQDGGMQAQQSADAVTFTLSLDVVMAEAGAP